MSRIGVCSGSTAAYRLFDRVGPYLYPAKQLPRLPLLAGTRVRTSRQGSHKLYREATQLA